MKYREQHIRFSRTRCRETSGRWLITSLLLPLALLGVLLLANPADAQTSPATSILVAGGGTLDPDDPATDGMPATSVLLGENFGLYVDDTETLYVPSGQGDGRINVVDELGNIFRFAGSGAAGPVPLDGTPALDANVLTPIDAIKDDAGNVYFSAWIPGSGDGRIFRVEPNGNIFTVAGGGAISPPGPMGWENVPALDVTLFQVYSLQLRDGFLYFAEWNRGHIARIDLSTNNVSTFAGGLNDRNAAPIPDPMNPPDARGFAIGDAQELDFDSSGNLYFFTRGSGTPDAIRRVAPGGTLHDVVTNNGTMQAAPGVAAVDLNFTNWGNGLAIDMLDNLYFAQPNSRIVILDLNAQAVAEVLLIDNFDPRQDIEVAPDGDIYFAQSGQVRRIEAAVPNVGPGDVTGELLLWLKADAGVFSDTGCSTVAAAGGEVACWQDQGATGLNALENPNTAAARPSFQPDRSNGQPALYFDSTDGLLTDPVQLYTQTDSPVTVFTVSCTPDAGRYQFLVNQPQGGGLNFELGYTTFSGNGRFGLHRGSSASTQAPVNTIVGNQYTQMTTSVLSTGTTPANVEFYINGVALASESIAGGYLNPGNYPTAASALDIGVRNDNGSGNYGQHFLGDIAEIIIYRRSLSPADQTSVENYLENKYVLSNPAGCMEPVPDMDNDTIPDNIDNCPINPNTDQLDTDLDGTGDVCDDDDDDDGLTDDDETTIYGTDPLDPDTDNDDLNDGDEVALGTDPLDSDSDDDGILDGAEVAGGTDPLDTDTDDDGVLNDTDNCPTVANPDQSDLDGDGLGDVCDPDVCTIRTTRW